jgi:hypothetical protein
MTTAPAPQRHRPLVIANTTCAGSELFREIRERADETETDVLIVAPALTSRLRYWMSDEDAGTAAAQQRLAASVEHCEAAGIAVRGALGDADPLAATDDAVRTFHPDEIIIATAPSNQSNWLEHGVVSQARERFNIPIMHVEIDSAHDDAHVVTVEPVDRRAPARERHPTRDLVILAGAVVLFILTSALTGVFYATGAPGWLIATWFIVFDLGIKIAIVVVVWMLFQRRPRADRLDY